MARARFPGKSSQQNGSRKRLWLPEDQFEECSIVTRKEASVAIRSSKNFGVLFSSSSKNPESLRRLSSCLGESVYAVSKRLRAFSAPAGEPDKHVAGNGGGAASPVGDASGRAGRRHGRTSSGESTTAPAQSFSAVEQTSPAAASGPRRGRTRSDASRAGSEASSESSEGGGRQTRASAATAEAAAAAAAAGRLRTPPPPQGAARRTRSRSHSQSASPVHTAASGVAADTPAVVGVRPRRAGAAATAGEQGPRPPEPSVRTRSASQAGGASAPPAAAPAPAPAAAPSPTPGVLMTRSSRVVRPARRFLDESGPASKTSAAPPQAPPPQPPAPSSSSSESARPPRPARALSPSSDVELDEGVIKTVVEYADNMAAASGGRGAAVAPPPPAAEPPPAAQQDIEAMLRAQWDSRLKVRGKEEEATAVSSRHLLRQPRLQLNNRVLKRLRDGRDLTYLSEEAEAPPGASDDGAAAAAGGSSGAAATQTSGGGGGHVTCGPCGCRRYVAVPSLCYKFGSWICMHCIKFVLTKLKQTSLAPKCLDDKELCRVYSDQSEPELSAPDARCHACWLKACLNALNFSEERHNRLRSSLPRAQQAGVPLFSRKRRQETGSCEYGPLPAPAPANSPRAPAPAASPAACQHKAWGGEAAPDPVGFEALSRPAPAAAEGPASPPTNGSRSDSPTGDGRQTESQKAAPPVRTPAVTRSRAQKWPPPPPGIHSRKAVTVVPLGGGWKRREFVRKGGRLDLIVYSPDGTRFKSVVELQAYLRGMDITRKAKSFFTDGPPPPSPPPAPPPPAKAPPSDNAAPPTDGVVRVTPEQVQPDVVLRDSFVKRGPRVKVVCRSASLVLGQPRATFGGSSPADRRASSPPPSPPPPPSSPPPPPQPPPAAMTRSPPPAPSGKENCVSGRGDGWAMARRHAVTVKKLKKRRHAGGDDKSSSRNVLMKLKVLHKYKHLQQSRGNKERMRKSRCGSCVGCKAKNCTKCVFCNDMIKYGGPGKLKKSCIRRVCKRPLLPGVNSLKLLPAGTPLPAGSGVTSPQPAASSSPLKTAAQTDPAPAALTQSAGRRSSPLVRLDHWSPRDPAQLWERGLAVLAAQPPGVPVLCFVCASAGKEEMLYCNSCCEPYHPFCLEEVEVPRSAQHQENWLCGRCQVCCVCGAAPAGQPLHRCHQCNETYHLACLGPHACPLPGRGDQPWMLGWPFAPAGPHALPAAAAAACSPPAGDLAPLVCHCCGDLPKVEDPAAGRRSPIVWRPPPLTFDWETMLGGRPDPAVASRAVSNGSADHSGASSDEEAAFSGFLRRDVLGATEAEADATLASEGEEQDTSLVDIVAIVDEDGEELETDGRSVAEHRKRKKRRRVKRLGKPPKKCRWKELSAQRRAAAAAVAAAAAALSDASPVKVAPFPAKSVEGAPPLPPPPPPLPEVYSIPFEYELLDQAAALELLFAGMNVPIMTGLELERIGLELGPLVEYREQRCPPYCTDSDSEASELDDEPLSVVDYLWETVDAELEALGYPPASVPFVLGGGGGGGGGSGDGGRRRCREDVPGPLDSAPRRSAGPGSTWASRRLPPGMTEQEWERWRRLLPPRKGRPRKYPRPDDLVLIEQLKQSDAGLRTHGPAPVAVGDRHAHLCDAPTPRSRPVERQSSPAEDSVDTAAESPPPPPLDLGEGPLSTGSTDGPPVLDRAVAAAPVPQPAAAERAGVRRRGRGLSTADTYSRRYLTSRSGAAGGVSYRQLLGLRGRRQPAAARLLQAGRRVLKAARRHSSRASGAHGSPTKGDGAAAEKSPGNGRLGSGNAPRNGLSSSQTSAKESPQGRTATDERRLKQETLDAVLAGADGLESGGLVLASDGDSGTAPVRCLPCAENGDGGGAGSPPAWCDALIEAVSDVSADAADALLADDAAESDGDDAVLDSAAEDALLADDAPAGGSSGEDGDAYLLSRYVDVQPSPASPTSGKRDALATSAANSSDTSDPYAKKYSTGAGRRRRNRGC